MRSIKKQCSLGWKIFIRHICSTNMIATLILIYLFEIIFLQGYKEFIGTVQYPITPWFVVFLFSELHFVIIRMTFIIYYFSDVPFMQRWQMYVLVRAGNVKWVISQMISILYGAIFISVVSIFEGLLILMPNIELSFDWGKTLRTIAVTNVPTEFGMRVKSNHIIISQFSPVGALLITLVINILAISLIGILMFAISLWTVRILSIVVASILVALPAFIQSLHVQKQMIGNYLSPISWLAIDQYGVESLGYTTMPQIEYILFAYIMLISFLVICIFIKARKIEFCWNKEK